MNYPRALFLFPTFLISILSGCDSEVEISKPKVNPPEKHAPEMVMKIDRKNIVRGQEFNVEQVIFRNDRLTFRQGK